MDINKELLVKIVLLIHMALTGLMLSKLFKLKSIQVGQLILSFIALVIPIIGPSALISFYSKQVKKQEQEADRQKNKKKKPHK